MTDTRARTETPIRQSASRQVDGCWMLSEQNVDYLEGAEERVFEILSTTQDLSSLSDELEVQGTNWFERYNLTKSRANILRPLNLGPDDTVLEVGAGCGAITRYLGETCGTVDALEPVRVRARVARQRTRDLSNVEVFVGGVEDLPPEPAYDTIVMVGVLEYSNGGSADPRDYIAFLQPLAQLLKPGGRIVCAIENQIGVKYLAGAPENHTSRVFDGLEQYPRGAQVRTFSRQALEAIFRGAGLSPQTLHAFPDYHLARIVFCDALLDSEASALAWSVPVFPSPDNTHERPHLASEALLWRTLVEAGVGSHFANAFLVIASRDAGSDIWPEGQLAAFYSTHRQAQFATESRVVRDGTGIQLQRRRIMGSEDRLCLGPLTVEVRDATFVPGESVLDLMARSDDAGLSEWIKRWLALLHDNVDGGEAANIDVGPPHMIVGDDGSITLIDQEMSLEGYSEQDVIQRQLVWLGVYLAVRTPPERWKGDTVRDVVVFLGEITKLDALGDWLPSAIRREAEFQALLADHRSGTDSWRDVVDGVEDHLTGLLDSRLEDGPLGTHEHERRKAGERALAEATAEQEGLRDEATKLQHDLRTKQGELDGAMRRIGDMEGSIGWRALNRARPLVRRFAPRGSLQFRALRATARAGFGVARRVRRPFTQGPGSPNEHARGTGKPLVSPLRVGCYGEHCWTVGGGTVHALQLLLPLLPYFDVELLLPPGAPLRDRAWYSEHVGIDIGDMKVRHYRPGVEDTFDVWLSVWNEKLWPAKTPKQFNLLFFPFVELDGAGFTHIVNSDYTAAHGRRRYHTDDVVVIPPHVNVDEFRSGPKEGLILHCSRFALPSAYADKAHVMMIQAFKQLVDRGLKGWKFVLAGATVDQGEEVYQEHLAKHAHGYPVEFAVNLPTNELRDLFARASVYWHATGYSVREAAAQEHFGITIVEGMAAGAVPISFNSGGPKEIITSGENGYLFDSIEELVNETWKLSHEPDHWRQMSQAARERARFFSAEMVKERVLRAVSGTEKVSIIIGTHNNREVLGRAIKSILRYTPPGFELIVVDNGSGDGTGAYLASLDYPHLTVIRNEDNKSYSAFNNQGLEAATREYILYLNDDVEAFPGWIDPLIDTLDRYPKVGAVGSRLFYPDGRVQHDGKMFSKDLLPHHVNMGGKAPANESAIEVDALTAACLLVRRELAGFDEDYLHGYYEDTDLCMRIKLKGYALVLHRGSVLIHYHGMTFGRNQAASEEAQRRNRKLFLDRWGERLPELVYLADEAEIAGTDVHCRPILSPEECTITWPVSTRLAT